MQAHDEAVSSDDGDHEDADYQIGYQLGRNAGHEDTLSLANDEAVSLGTENGV